MKNSGAKKRMIYYNACRHWSGNSLNERITAIFAGCIRGGYKATNSVDRFDNVDHLDTILLDYPCDFIRGRRISTKIRNCMPRFRKPVFHRESAGWNWVYNVQFAQFSSIDIIPPYVARRLRHVSKNLT